MTSEHIHSRTIDDICSVNGHRAQTVAPLPATAAPNLDAIQKVYDTAFAPGLDQFLETGPTSWFIIRGFSYLVSDRSLLSQFLLYLTMVSNSANAIGQGLEHATLASQEARITWALMNLCANSAQDGDDDDAERICRRVKAIEAILTGEPLVRSGSMADFVHQEEVDQDIDMAVETSYHTKEQTTFQKQLARRSEDFWKLIEKAAEHPNSVAVDMDRIRGYLDGLENRDIVYSSMLVSTLPRGHNVTEYNDGDNTSPNRAAKRQEKELARRFLQSEADGRATNLVFANIAGMALRAFQ